MKAFPSRTFGTLPEQEVHGTCQVPASNSEVHVTSSLRSLRKTPMHTVAVAQGHHPFPRGDTRARCTEAQIGRMQQFSRTHELVDAALHEVLGVSSLLPKAVAARGQAALSNAMMCNAKGLRARHLQRRSLLQEIRHIRQLPPELSQLLLQPRADEDRRPKPEESTR